MLILSTNVDQKSLETEFGNSICRQVALKHCFFRFLICVRRLLRLFYCILYGVDMRLKKYGTFPTFAVSATKPLSVLMSFIITSICFCISSTMSSKNLKKETIDKSQHARIQREGTKIENRKIEGFLAVLVRIP